MRLKLTPLACALALGLGILATSAHASLPILSVSNVATDSFNLGQGAILTTSGPTVSTYAGSYNAGYNTTYSTVLSSEVQTQPTTTTAGQTYNYSTLTTTTTWNEVKYKEDRFQINVGTNGTNQSGGKWISMTGNVSSIIDTSLSFDLFASGRFTASQTPFGSAAPLLASFYFGGAQPTALSASTSADLENLSYYTYASSYATQTFSLLAGVSQSFVAYVYAPNDVSISHFRLNAETSDYDVITSAKKSERFDKTLLGADILAPIPEPESYAMLLAGLGVIGSIVRRRKNAR